MDVKSNENMNRILITFFLSFLCVAAWAQSESDTIKERKVISGNLIDAKTSEPLTYATILIVGSTNGVVSNEKGYFEIDITGFPETDTIRFQYIGYKPQQICISDYVNSDVELSEEIYNLSETVVYGTPPKAKDIVKKIIENKERNYPVREYANQVFVRERYNSDLNKVDLNCKKSSIEGLDENFIGIIQKSVPKESVSYTDFLGWVYSNGEEGDSAKIKIDPIRMISLKEKDIAELERIEEVFEKVIKETKDDEYWKVKTGILSQKIDMDEGDTTNVKKKDSVPENTRLSKYYSGSLYYRMKYANLDNKDQWEFLHKTGKYKYTIAGGTSVNGEEVYIIDFEPSGSGMFTGKMFVSRNTYALIRADYQYAAGKNGRDFHMFGIGYTESQFAGSIYFEKVDSVYALKYFTTKSASEVSFDRSVSLLKKRKRWLFDKKVNEIKIGIDMYVSSEMSYEYLVTNKRDFEPNEFDDFEQKERMKVIYVDQFDDNLWAGYPVIAPTKKMKEYKKHGEF